MARSTSVSRFPARHAGLTALALASALAMAACGGGGNDPVVVTPVPPVPQALGAPTLTFTGPQDSLDLSNYILTGRYTLPVNEASGANQIAKEVSAVTYNEATDTLFIIGDEGTYITQLSKTGAVIDTMTLPAGLFGDPEGLSWAGGNTFVVANERERTATLLTYTGGTTLDAATVRTVKLGTTVGNIGLEGVSRDPATGGFIFVKEMTEQGIFQTSIDFAAGTASNGSASTVNSVNLFAPALMGMSDIADVYAMSNGVAATAPDYQHLLVLGQEDGRILKVDRAGRIHGRLDLPNAPLNLGHEGLTLDRQLNLYVTNEAGGGSQSLPQLWVYTPTRSAAQVGLGSNLYLNFPGAVAAGTGTITLTGSGGDTRSIAVTDSSQVSFSGSTVKINPTADLLPSTSYSVQYAAGVFKDGTGLATQAVGSAQALAFTSVPDTSAPLLQASSPADNASGVAVNANITLTFNEPVRAGTGSFTLSNGSDDVRTISANDGAQVSYSGNTVTLNPSGDLRTGAAYAVQVSATALQDRAGNAFAGIADSVTLNFVTEGAAVVPAPRLLITEVNSSGIDFFEIFNYGSTPATLSGWKWDDDSASSTDAGSRQIPDAVIPANGRLLVVTGGTIAAFRTTWGLAADVPAVETDGPGLGSDGDMVVLFNATGQVAASFSYKAAAVTASDSTVINRSLPAAGITPLATGHAGAVFGGNATSSAVWDGLSTSEPRYRVAVAGVLGAAAQPAAATAIGSPGR